MVNPKPSRTFPDHFKSGFTAAAPRIEGAACTDGKRLSVWDTFARQPGRVLGGDTLDVACDHYQRYAEDLTLMARLLAKYDRLSVAWPRIYLREVQPAIDDGVPIDGYFLWSFMGNFEWTEGYARRFGVVFHDYATQQRAPKASAHWHSAVMRHHCIQRSPRAAARSTWPSIRTAA